MGFPNYYVESVLVIRPDWLREKGTKTVLLDLDNTVLARDQEDMDPAIVAWIESLEETGIQVCLVSNAWFGRVPKYAKRLNLRYVDHAVKPLPPAFILALWKCRSWPWQTTMVGDQLFTDVLGGTLLGMMTIMVLPLAEFDLKHTLMLRHLEKLIIRDRKPLSSL